MSIKAEDEVEKLFVASTHAVMLFFTTEGRVFARKVHELPDVGPGGRGRALVNLLQLEAEERVAALLAVRDFAEHEDAFLLFATRLGKVKRTPLSEYANIRASGLRAIAINPGDDLLSVHLTDGTLHVFIGTHRGMGIRFEEAEARPMGRVSAGVRGINLREGDWVEEVATLDPTAENDILVVTDLGFGKRTPVGDFRLQQRGGYGLKAIQLTSKNGTVAAIRHVHESDQILVLTEGGILIRMIVGEIRRSGRATQGVRVIRLDEGDRVVSVAKLAEDDGSNGDDAGADDTGVAGGDTAADA
jgi:DNA gyrase subunit A